MRNGNTAASEVVSESGAMVVSAVGVAFFVALWFASMLFLVRGFVDGASTQAMTNDSAYETVVL